MTWNDIVSGLFLALVDALNPATMVTMMVLLPLVKQKWHALFFVFGTYLIYFAAGYTIYLGFTQFIQSALTAFLDRYSTLFGWVECIIGASLILLCIAIVVRYVRKLRANQPIHKDFITPIVTYVNPLTIFLFAILSTFMDLPTAIPYFAWIGILSATPPDILILTMLFTIYCLIYVMPMVAIYFVYGRIQGERYSLIESRFRHFMNRASTYLIPIFLFFIGIWLISDGLSRVT